MYLCFKLMDVFKKNGNLNNFIKIFSKLILSKRLAIE